MAKVVKQVGRQRKNKAQLAQYLRGLGIAPGKVLQAQAKGDKGMLREVCGVTDAQYQAAGGTLEETDAETAV